MPNFGHLSFLRTSAITPLYRTTAVPIARPSRPTLWRHRPLVPDPRPTQKPPERPEKHEVATVATAVPQQLDIIEAACGSAEAPDDPKRSA